jgi:hypothetical protein
MYLSKTILGLSLTVHGALSASVLTVTNQCAESVHVVYDNERYQAATLNLATGKSFNVRLLGKGILGI